jgi:glycosyltransferase involved in cell wall biosynthesis
VSPAARQSSLQVVFVINGLGTGGAEHSLAAMLPGMTEAGIEPIIVVFQRRAQGVEAELIEAGHDIRFCDQTTLPGRVRFVRSVLTDGIDLVHTQIYDANVTGRLAATGSGVPVLTSLVNTSYDKERLRDPNLNRWKITGVRAIDGFTARRLTTHFHAISHAVKDAAVEALHIDPARVTVIERGRDPDRFRTTTPEHRAAAKTALGIDPGTPVLVNVGRQEYQKGQGHLLAAMGLAPVAGSSATLLIAGRRGNASHDLEAQAAGLGLGDRVRILGHRDDITDVLAAADVFVFPSLFEGIGGAVIEAMASGLPIVASDIPAMREILEPEQNALLVAVGDPSGLSVAVGRLLADETTRTRFGRRSRQIFEANFTLERAVTRMVELYREVAAAGRR